MINGVTDARAAVVGQILKKKSTRKKIIEYQIKKNKILHFPLFVCFSI